MDYITVQNAAKKMNVCPMAVYTAIKRKSLKAVKVNNVLHTTEGWIREYYKNWRNREVVSRFNGMKTFDEKKGELSTKRVAKLLGIKKQGVYRLIYTGQLKCTRKGSYYIITQEDIDAYINKIEIIETQVVC